MRRVLDIAAAMLACALMLLAAPASAEPQSAPQHLAAASWLVTTTDRYTAPPASIDSANLPGPWHPLTLPSTLPRGDRRADDIDTTWIRVTVPASAQTSGPLAIYGARVTVEGTIAVYVNGRLAHRAQQQGPLWDSPFTPLWITLDSDTDAAPVREILVRLEHQAHSRVALSSLWFGASDALHSRYYTRLWLQRELPATLNAAFLLVGLFSLAVWLIRRHKYEYLLFFYLAAASFVGHLHYYLSLPVTGGWFAWLTANALFWLVTVLHLFLRKLHGRPLVWLTRVLVGVSAAITVLSMPLVAILPVYPSTSVLVPLVYAVVVVMAATVCIVAAACSWRRSREGLLLAAGLGLCTLLGVPDWLMHNHVASAEGWFTGAYTNAVTFCMFGILMARRYVNAIRGMENSNASLEQRLQKREAELEIIHSQLREAANRQTISDERQRLMQDMHDGLGSSLINAIRSVDQTDISTQKISQILKDCLDDLKLTIDSMEPIEADLLMLLGSLRFRLEPRLEGTGITLRWEIRDLPPLPWLEPGSALSILRIIQESIANILRHTPATEIRLSTRHDVEGDGVQVTVSDNGGGFDLAATLQSPGGRGIRNQQRRARSVNGRVDWACDGSGTRFTLWLPLTRA
jgi:signal transduction histidine kinase